jgi:hypothetical protein
MSVDICFPPMLKMFDMNIYSTQWWSEQKLTRLEIVLKTAVVLLIALWTVMIIMEASNFVVLQMHIWLLMAAWRPLRGYGSTIC